jgi:hypothetical protein
MSPKQEYKNPLTRAIVRLIEMTVEGKDADGNPTDGKDGANFVIKIAWKSIKPQLPMMLYSLDNSPAALQAIQEEMLKVSQENLVKQKGPGYLAWVNPECPDESRRIEPLCPS